jgi:DNA adenine methylase
MNTSTDIPTFLKWAGGKRRLLDKLEPFLPEKINAYFEPFLGGGAFFFFVMQKLKPRKAFISDLNENLVETFKSVRDNPAKLIKQLEKFKSQHSETFYYGLRKAFNQHEVKGIARSAAFIYLNKACYSGIYRVNSKNEFNVPYGKYKNTSFFTNEALMRASSLLRNVEIYHSDYRSILPQTASGDFVYLDPCYDPINKTSFVQYTPERFKLEDRIALSEFVNKLDERGVSVLLSNNDIAPVRKMYSHLKIEKLSAPRSLSYRWAHSKGVVSEIAIHNY